MNKEPKLYPCSENSVTVPPYFCDQSYAWIQMAYEGGTFTGHILTVMLESPTGDKIKITYGIKEYTIPAFGHFLNLEAI